MVESFSEKLIRQGKQEQFKAKQSANDSEDETI